MLKYLEFLDQVKHLNKKFELSYFEIELLNMTAKAHFSEQPIFVGDLIRQRNIASQGTLHAAMKVLLAKKLLSTKFHEEDGRIKKVALTKISIEHYKKIRQAMN